MTSTWRNYVTSWLPTKEGDGEREGERGGEEEGEGETRRGREEERERGGGGRERDGEIYSVYSKSMNKNTFSKLIWMFYNLYIS